MSPDRAVSEVASRQYGNVTTAQMLECGLTRSQIQRRVALGRLHRRFRGVYAVGYLSEAPLAAESAALLAIGPDAALSHRSAAVFWGLLPRRRSAAIDVVVPGTVNRGRPGIAVHRAGAFAEADVWTRRGLRVTTPARTLVDLAATNGPTELARAVDAAYAAGLVRPGELVPPPGHRGAARLRAVLEGRGVTRSGLERRFLALVRRAGLPAPETNVRIAGHEVDALWREQRVVVELDTLGTHATKVLTDRAKELALRQAGWEPLRVTDVLVDERPLSVVADLARALARATAAPRVRP